jgi:hypothetical protein
MLVLNLRKRVEGRFVRQKRTGIGFGYERSVSSALATLSAHRQFRHMEQKGFKARPVALDGALAEQTFGRDVPELDLGP